MPPTRRARSTGAGGHQNRLSPTTSTLSSYDQPGHAFFILTSDSPNDWRSPQNNNLWQGENGINNPCPLGYRLPTAMEWDAERESWSSDNSAGAFASPLKLPMAGNRNYHNGGIGGSLVRYWSSSLGPVGLARCLGIYNGDASMSNDGRARGSSVRCIKD